MNWIRFISSLILKVNNSSLWGIYNWQTFLFYYAWQNSTFASFRFSWIVLQLIRLDRLQGFINLSVSSFWGENFLTLLSCVVIKSSPFFWNFRFQNHQLLFWLFYYSRDLIWFNTRLLLLRNLNFFNYRGGSLRTIWILNFASRLTISFINDFSFFPFTPATLEATEACI